MAFDTDVNEGVEDQGEDTPLDKTEAETTEEAKAEPDADSEDNDDADTEGEDKPEGDEPDGETEPEKKPSRASDRIRELSAKAKAAEAEAEQLRQQLQQRDDPQQKQDKPQSADGAPVKPNVEDFDLETQLDEYFEAQQKYDEQMDEWKFDQRLKQREQAKQQEAANTEIEGKFKSRFDENPKFKDDFQELATMMQDKPINADPMQLYDIDDALDIVQEIAANPDLYYEIADMSEQRQYAEFGKLHAQIQSRKSAPKTARQSKAPPPPNHTKANAPAKRSPYSGSDDEFMEARGL